MSLFKICSFWNYQCPDSEKNYDSFSLSVGHMMERNVQREVIIVFSHTGVLSIFQGTLKDSGTVSVLLEVNLKEPIIGALIGNFVSGTKSDQYNTIAILHPRKLVIYSVVTSEGLSEQGNESKLQVVNEVSLQKSAFSMCKGYFGGARGKDSLCIMSLDGSLSFFEQDRIAHECMLPGTRTIPSNIIYIPRTDCFVLLSPNWDLECYRYLNLSESFERSFGPIWTLNIGESLLDITSHQINNHESLIVMLGENNLICVSDTGKLKFIKKLEYSPIAFCTFVVGWYWEPDAQLMIAVASNNGSLLIYNFSNLVWCAEVSTDLISVKRVTLGVLSGGLITLSDSGKLDVNFLGSEPHVFQVPPLKLTKLDYEKSIQELLEMEKEINANANNNYLPALNAMAEKEVDIMVNISFDNLNEGESCILNLNLNANSAMEQVQMLISTNSGLIIQENIFFLKEVVKGETYILKSAIYGKEDLEAYDLHLNIYVSFINKQSIARIIKQTISIPGKSFYAKTNPQKDGLFKVTFSLKNRIADLGDLFPEYITTSGTQVLGLRSLRSGNTCTVILAKNSNRFRLQSNNLPTLLFFFNVLCHILEELEPRREDHKIFSVASIPASTVEYALSCIEKHYGLVKELNDTINAMNEKSLQMRLFERCFLKQIQGKSLNSLEGIETLLKETHREIIGCAHNFQNIKVNIQRVQYQLNSTLSFIEKTMKFMDIPDSVKKSIRVFTVPILDWTKTCWQEAGDAYVKYLYNLFQLKMNKNQLYENFNFHQDTFSIVRFKKNLKSVLDNIFENINESVKEVEKTLVDLEKSDDVETKNEENESEWKMEVSDTLKV